MRLLAFSDLHLDVAARDAVLAAAGGADLVIGAGDFANQHEGLEDFVAPFDAIASKAVFVCGNNETLDALRAATAVPVLHGETMEFGGIVVAGIGCAVPPLPPLPWQSFDISEAEAEALLAPIPQAHVLVSHSPPRDVADRISGGGSVGSVAVREAAERMAPRYLFCGHVHDCWGERGTIGTTEVVNLGPGVHLFDIEA